MGTQTSKVVPNTSSNNSHPLDNCVICTLSCGDIIQSESKSLSNPTFEFVPNTSNVASQSQGNIMYTSIQSNYKSGLIFFSEPYVEVKDSNSKNMQ